MQPIQQHTWMEVKWFASVEEPELDETEQLRQAMAPRFYTSTARGTKQENWIPVQSMLARCICLACDDDSGLGEGTMFTCRLPRKVGL
jgi:hypothetical protein